MKTNAIVRIVIFSIALLILASILLVGIGAKYFTFEPSFQVSEDDQGLTSQCTFPADKVKQISIDWVAGSISIQPDDNAKEITVCEKGYTEEKYRMECTNSGNTLNIDYCKDNFQVNFGFSVDSNITKDLLITVPSGWLCDKLEIDAASADLKVTDLTINKVDFEGASGECDFDNCQVEVLDMDTASGNVEFFGTLNSLDFDGASADCELRLLTTPKRIDVDTMSGDLELYLPADSGFAVSMDTMSGNVHSDFETVIMGNDDYVYGDGACRINISALSGNVGIYKLN